MLETLSLAVEPLKVLQRPYNVRRQANIAELARSAALVGHSIRATDRISNSFNGLLGSVNRAIDDRQLISALCRITCQQLV